MASAALMKPSQPTLYEDTPMTIVNAKRAAARIRWQRDLAIAQLIKARRHKKASRPILAAVLECVAALRKVANDNIGVTP